MISPTVGRVVLYRPTASDPLGHEGDEKRRYAAHVAHVWTDTCVNLMVIDPNGVPFNRTSVYLAQDALEPQPGQCEWMSYQKGQAAKTEALEATLSKGNVGA